MKKIVITQNNKQFFKLKAGDVLLLSGFIFTARDQAHKRLVSMIQQKKKLPFSLRNQIVYYCGPTGTPSGKVIGSCGPTTASRMDNFTIPLLRHGLLGMIGKGQRSKRVREAIKKYKSIYFVAPAGCGALVAQKVLSKKLVCFADLGPEAVYSLQVKDLPLIVAIDCRGRSIYPDLEDQ